MDDSLKAFADGAYADTRKGLEDSVQRPLDPDAKKLTGQERKMADAAFLADPLLVAGEADAQSARFKLPAGTVSRRVWDRVKRAAREAEDA
jgi:hypothetical protein